VRCLIDEMKSIRVPKEKVVPTARRAVAGQCTGSGITDQIVKL